MEANTVILSLNDYNRMRDLEIEIQKNDTFYVNAGNVCWNYHIVTKDEAVKTLINNNKNLSDKLNETTLELHNLKAGVKTNKIISIDQVKKMSIWQFLKWRRK